MSLSVVDASPADASGPVALADAGAARQRHPVRRKPYVALAERLRAPLVTCDAQLVAAAGAWRTVDLVT